jgi:hypothetical protein
MPPGTSRGPLRARLRYHVLAVLGALGLRPPMAPMDGPNVVARERGRTFIRQALKAQQ